MLERYLNYIQNAQEVLSNEIPIDSEKLGPICKQLREDVLARLKTSPFFCQEFHLHTANNSTLEFEEANFDLYSGKYSVLANSKGFVISRNINLENLAINLFPTCLITIGENGFSISSTRIDEKSIHHKDSFNAIEEILILTSNFTHELNSIRMHTLSDIMDRHEDNNAYNEDMLDWRSFLSSFFTRNR